MTDTPAPANSQKERKTLLITGIMVLVLLVLAWPIKKYFFDRPPKPSSPALVEIEPLCQYIQTLKLNCVVTPAAEGVLGPGHFVAYSTTVIPHPKVPFSKGDLFSAACAVPICGSKSRGAILACNSPCSRRYEHESRNHPICYASLGMPRNFTNSEILADNAPTG